MNLKELLYLIWYSLKDLVMDLVSIFSALKKAKTWSFILYATIFLLAYYKYLTRTNAIIVISLILILYIIRQHKEPGYNMAVREKAFKNNEVEKIKVYYDRYKKDCYYSLKEALNYEDYKKMEIKKLDEKYIQSSQSDVQY